MPHPVLPKIAVDSYVPAAPIEFTDVGADHWAKVFLDNLSAQGSVAGFPDGSFQPDRPITRLELAVHIARMFELSQQPAPDFQDVPASHWAYKSIQAAAQMGFLKGLPGNQFQPDASISRTELLVAIASGLGLSEPFEPSQILVQFQDHDQVPAWAVAPIAAAIEAEIVVNYPDLDYINPQAAATRAEAAAILHQSLVYIGRLSTGEFPYVVPTPR